MTRTSTRPPTRRLGAAVLVLLASGCTLTAQDADDELGAGSSTSGGSGPALTDVTLLTHDSFTLPKRLVREFEQDSGYDLEIRSSGDAGALTNKLALSQGSPQGDVAFGVDNTFASRALDENVFAQGPADLPPGAAAYALADGDARLTPIDTGSVCVNVDTAWFEERDLAAPETLEDLTQPAYAGLFVTPSAATSSPGMAFLLATIAEYGEDWPEYWERLLANGTRITSGWSDAYYVDFTAGGGDGDRPIVLSYDSSPAFTLTEDGTASTTRALLETCYRQVEYAGVLTGAANPEGAAAVVEWLLGPDVQAALPTSMYVFPVVDATPIPPDWARFAERAEETYEVDPDEVAANRADWLATYTDVVTR